MRLTKSAAVARWLAAAFGMLLCVCTSLAREIWIDVPFVRQSPNGCGTASIAMVIQYWDAKSGRTSVPRETEYAIYARLYSKKDKGVPATAMQEYFKAQGFRAFVVKGTWQDLQHHLALGRPLIVCLMKGRTSHYVVVSGIDTDRDIVLVNDPAGRKLSKHKREEFESGWRGSGDWTLLALP